ncbi:MAG: response regulator transcription factor [Bacteroidetes bacterium]|nr:response regulator transcription factor [Bacteroidota bacterium]
MLTKDKNIAVVIVEDHSIFIEGLCSVLQNVEGVNVAGTFTSGEPAIDFIGSHPTDVVFLDISLPEMSGIEVCQKIKAIDRNIKVIALSNHTEKSVITEILQKGADGYLLKNTSRKDLVNAIFQVRDNQMSMNAEVQSILFAPTVPRADVPRLTRRETEILKLVSEGATTPAIAKKLFISPQTVETHRKNMMQKFKVNNSAALIKKAIENNIIN